MARPGTVGRWLAAIGALGLAAVLATAAIAHHGSGRPAPIVVAAGASADDDGTGFHEVDPTRVLTVGDGSAGSTTDGLGPTGVDGTTTGTTGGQADGGQGTASDPAGTTLPSLPTTPTLPTVPSLPLPPAPTVPPLPPVTTPTLPLVDPLDDLLDSLRGLPTTTLPPLGLPLSSPSPMSVPGP